MSSNLSFVSSGDLLLSYKKFGQGDEIVVCLHGHGRDPEDFEFLLNDKRTIISIVLFHHGQSFFPEERIEKNPLSQEEFLDLFNSILKKENISTFHLVAFSQGGRFAMIIFQEYFQNVSSVNLISPDGMDNQSFYNRMSRKKWARRLFLKWEENPKKVITYAKIAKRLNLMRPKVLSFVEKFAKEKDDFRRASLTWRGFRQIQPNEELLKSILENFDRKFQIIMGSYDQVIRPKQAYAFAQRIGKPLCIVEIPCGHNFFSDKNQKLIEEVMRF
jgi:pimeloyl-ACP methyl ester carboxylesterase